MTHPLMYVLGGKTETATFPLIMIIGREPNCDAPLDDSIGQMFPAELRIMRGGVWVVAHSQIGRQLLPSCTGGQLKRLLIDADVSPLVFTNLYPIGLSVATGSKQAKRDAIPSAIIDDHMQRILKHPLMSRVKLVINHSNCVSANTLSALQALQDYCAANGVAYCETPFFFFTNSKRIESELRVKASSVIQGIFHAFDPVKWP
jgi:hypothetical protein